MGSKLLALAAAAVAIPALAQEIERPATPPFYMAIPLDGRTATPSFGIQFQGSRPYQFVKLDYQAFRALPTAWSAIEAKAQSAQSPQDQQAQPCPVVCAPQK